MAERERRPRIDQPREGGRRWSMPTAFTEEAFGVVSEKFARYMGTPYFLIGMTLFVRGLGRLEHPRPGVTCASTRTRSSSSR